MPHQEAYADLLAYLVVNQVKPVSHPVPCYCHWKKFSVCLSTRLKAAQTGQAIFLALLCKQSLDFILIVLISLK